MVLRLFSLHIAMLAVAIGALLDTSCVRLDEGHCIVNGGDFSCDEGRICITDIDRHADLSDEGDGCVLEEQVDPSLDGYSVRVQYGLPRDLGSYAEDIENDLQSVIGVLFQAALERGVDEVCVPDEELVRSFEAQWKEVDEVREFLDRPTRVRAASAALDSDQVDAIEDFNEAINAWVNECEALAGGR